MPDVEIVYCGQPGCDGEFVFGRTVRDPAARAGGRKMPVDWPLPIDARKRDGTVLPPAPGMPVPNLGVRFDQWGSMIVRVADRHEPIRADENPAYPHWATCKNPPTKRRPVAAPAPVAEDQDQLDLGLPGDPSPKRAPGILSDARLFPPRKVRGG